MQAVLAFAAASVCLAGCGALIDLPDNPRVEKSGRNVARRGEPGPATLLDPATSTGSPSGGPSSASSPGPDDASGSVNDAGADRQPSPGNAGEVPGAVASPERDAGLSGAIRAATRGAGGIAWALPEPVDGTYAFHIRIDALRFIPAVTGQP